MTNLRSTPSDLRTRLQLLYGAAAVLALAAALGPMRLAAQPRGGVQAVHRYVSAHERYVDHVLMGADGVLVGLEAGRADGSLPRDQLIVHLPPTDADSLCVSIRSIDGRYEGIFQFAARPMPRGPVLVDVRSPEYPEQRAAYAPERLAVHASLGSSCSSGTGTTVLAGRTRAAPDALRLSLNADAGMLVRAEMAPAAPASEPVRCPLVGEPNPYAFNRTCTVPLPPAGPYQLRLTLCIPGQPPRRITYPVEAP
ncbi:MAG TPA: hypothetical protein VFR37_01545 [Longimicrobium sp.]|nr:hypothetical protein [Longimicrobium sp.]